MAMYNAKKQIKLNNKTVLVTGSPGFIGANLVLRLLTDASLMKEGTIISFDNMNDYYDTSLKEYRLSLINEAAKQSNISHIFIKGNVADKELVEKVFEEYQPDIVVHLAAQAGVRYSIENPDVYIESNIVGFFNILEACRHSYDDGARGVNISYMLPHLLYMEAIRKFHLTQMIKWIILYLYMQRRRRAMNC